MQASVADAGPLRKQLTITIPADEVAERRGQLLDRFASQVNLKGFRKGKKPPKSLIEKRAGSAADAQVYEDLVNEGFRKGVTDHQLKPLGQVEVEDSKRDNGITHIVSFDVAPSITLPDPSSIDVSKEDTSASAEEIDKELGDYAKRMGEYHELGADDDLAEEDVLTFSGTVTSGDETVRDLHDLQHLVGGYPLLGQEPATIVDLVKGAKVGGAIEFDTTLPESFTPETWAGKEAHVALTIQAARRMVPAAIDDNLATKLGVESLDELKQRLEQMIQGRKSEELQGKQSKELMDALLERCQFELPERLFKQLVDSRLEAAKRQAEAKQDQDQIVDEGEITKATEQELRRHLIVEAIADQFQVQATRQDVDQQIAMAAWQSGRKPEEIAKQLQESGRIQEVAAEIRSNKAVAIFLDKVVGDAHAPADASDAETSDA